MKTQGAIRRWGVAGATVLGMTLAVAPALAQSGPLARPQSTVAASQVAAGKPLADAERKTADELQAAQKQFDASGARVMATTPDGRRRVAETIARQFGVPEKVVSGLRARRMGYGEVTIALALSQQLMRREKGLSQTQAIDKVVALRKSGMGWGVVARDLGLKLGDVVSEVKKADAQVARHDTTKIAKAEKPARPEKPGKLEKMDRPEKPGKLEKAR